MADRLDGGYILRSETGGDLQPGAGQHLLQEFQQGIGRQLALQGIAEQRRRLDKKAGTPEVVDDFPEQIRLIGDQFRIIEGAALEGMVLEGAHAEGVNGEDRGGIKEGQGAFEPLRRLFAAVPLSFRSGCEAVQEAVVAGCTPHHL